MLHSCFKLNLHSHKNHELICPYPASSKAHCKWWGKHGKKIILPLRTKIPKQDKVHVVFHLDPTRPELPGGVKPDLLLLISMTPAAQVYTKKDTLDPLMQGAHDPMHYNYLHVNTFKFQVNSKS